MHGKDTKNEIIYKSLTNLYNKVEMKLLLPNCTIRSRSFWKILKVGELKMKKNNNVKLNKVKLNNPKNFKWKEISTSHLLSKALSDQKIPGHW